MHNQNNTSRKIPTVKFVRADRFFFAVECFDAFFYGKKMHTNDLYVINCMHLNNRMFCWYWQCDENGAKTQTPKLSKHKLAGSMCECLCVRVRTFFSFVRVCIVFVYQVARERACAVFGAFSVQTKRPTHCWAIHRCFFFAYEGTKRQMQYQLCFLGTFCRRRVGPIPKPF